jgi:hypothetical protein
MGRLLSGSRRRSVCRLCAGWITPSGSRGWPSGGSTDAQVCPALFRADRPGSWYVGLEVVVGGCPGLAEHDRPNRNAVDLLTDDVSVAGQTRDLLDLLNEVSTGPLLAGRRRYPTMVKVVRWSASVGCQECPWAGYRNYRSITGRSRVAPAHPLRSSGDASVYTSALFGRLVPALLAEAHSVCGAAFKGACSARRSGEGRGARPNLRQSTLSSLQKCHLTGVSRVVREISRSWRTCMRYLLKHDRRGSAQGFARAVGA